MKEQIQKRLSQLKSEYESGQKMLADLQIKEMNLKETLLRISGAIQVLEEMANKDEKVEREINELTKTPD